MRSAIGSVRSARRSIVDAASQGTGSAAADQGIGSVRSAASAAECRWRGGRRRGSKRNQKQRAQHQSHCHTHTLAPGYAPAINWRQTGVRVVVHYACVFRPPAKQSRRAALSSALWHPARRANESPNDAATQPCHAAGPMPPRRVPAPPGHLHCRNHFKHFDGGQRKQRRGKAASNTTAAHRAQRRTRR